MRKTAKFSFFTLQSHKFTWRIVDNAYSNIAFARSTFNHLIIKPKSQDLDL
ncbi:hypothetical protein HMPREF0208_05049 [Citrobacter koseri]|uniref:Uncharacterized protein n=1 Tax=Citrobacter koseri (strain ATCC BAA-895 / CDC 4225-83 / SGSC4696) TaxID=290338 RepID=A8ALJ3_CITK8|nr:hypothetical protein CKO_03272 [Citrobacter koseri ATCC BAA-895]KWZ95006.1 hypothetical protein HMPREF3220_04435 [Citrobacter koseri]KXA01914.1 hypothetical protein HMPREF3207_02616 [Citrobacter koseri]KXB38837.1 hypothetical protein HMPREF0208_05049 [Citrobacter koseri]